MTPLEHVLHTIGYGRPVTPQYLATLPPFLRFVCVDPKGIDRVVLMRYRADDLAPEERLKAEDHLSGCPECKRYLAHLESRWARLKQGLDVLTAVEVQRRAKQPNSH